MYMTRRVDAVLDTALDQIQVTGAPPLLAEAARYAVFPGGARIRPHLCMAVAAACDDSSPTVSQAAAASIELLHCASLVHDDLPCFDDASMRRGKPSVHQAYGQPIAVLTGDALIVLAFDLLARRSAHESERLAALVMILSRAVGLPSGIVAGQAWECEPAADLSIYHQQKTGALFAGATMAGAAAAGMPHESWRALGQGIGEAFQIADDILDATSTEKDLGKPVGQDSVLERPNAVSELGLAGAAAKLRDCVDAAVESVPDCPGRALLQSVARQEATKFVPAELMHVAA